MPLIRNKAIRRTFKAISFTVGIVLLLFACLSLYVEANKKEILDKIKAEVSKNIQSEITYREADITVWKHFPFVGVHLYDIYVEDSLYHKPFFKMKEASCKISVLQYVFNNIEVRDVSFSNGLLHIFTDTSGYTNKYLMHYKNEKKEKDGKDIKLDHAQLHNVRVILENKKRNKLFDFLFHGFKADISEIGDVFTFHINQKTKVNSLGFNLLKGSYLKGQMLETDMQVKFYSRQAKLSFNEENFIVDGHTYKMKGEFRLRDAGFFHLEINTTNTPYQNIAALLPANISNKLKNFDFEKPISLTAVAEGQLSYGSKPMVFAKWIIKNNALITPVATFRNCNFKGSFNNEKQKGLGKTDENTEIKIDNFSGNWEGIQLYGDEITINNLTDPQINLNLQSSTDLASLNNKLGLQTIELINGKASLSFHYAGPIKPDLSILDNINGKLQFSNGTIKYLPRNFIFNNCSGVVMFSNNNMQVNDLKCDFGESHFEVNVTGTNLDGLSANDAGNATISCNVFSPLINISDFKTLFAKRKTGSVPQKKGKGLIGTTDKIDEVMDHGSLSLNVQANEVRYNNFSGRNARAKVEFVNNDLFIRQASLQHADGNLSFTADIKDKNTHHAAKAKVNLQHVNVSKVFYAFDNFGQDGIESKNLNGTLNTASNLSFTLDNSGSILPGSIKGIVDLSLKNGSLVNYEPLLNIKQSFLKNRDLSNIRFAELKNILEINGSKITINKMEIQSSAITLFVDGLYDINKVESRINIQVPLKSLKEKDSSFVPKNGGLDVKRGTSVYLVGKNDKTGKVKFVLNTKKTITNIFSRK